jgi:hypothetical protein
MGITATLKRVTPALRDILRGDRHAGQVFALNQPRAPTIRPNAPEFLQPALRARLEALDQQPTGTWLVRDRHDRYGHVAQHLDLFEREWLDPALDLDKLWHVLHFVLCRSEDTNTDPLSWAILGREELTPGLDDPPVRFLDDQSVFETAAALKLREIEILEELDWDRRPSHVYHWFEGEKADILRPYFDALRTYYVEAAERGMAMLMWRG